MLLEQLTSLEQWVAERLPEELHRPPLQDHVATLHQIIEQDLEPDPDDPGGAPSRIRQGVAEDRRVSIEDKEMRDGRKTKSKRFNGYKRHRAIDLDTVLVLAVAVLPFSGRLRQIHLAAGSRSTRRHDPVTNGGGMLIHLIHLVHLETLDPRS